MSRKDKIVLMVLVLVTIAVAIAFFTFDKVATTISKGGSGGLVGKIGNKITSANLADVAKRIGNSVIILHKASNSAGAVNTSISSSDMVAMALEYKAAEVLKKIDKEWKSDPQLYAQKKELMKENALVYEYGDGPAYYVLILDEMVLRGYIDQDVRDCIHEAYMAQWGSSKFSADSWVRKYMGYIR